jgi:hypothetical protein
MNKFLLISLFVALATLTPKFADAQLKEMLKKKALEAVKNAVGEDEKAKPKETPPQQTEPQQPKQQPGQSYLEKKMLEKMGFANVKFDPSYNFSSTMVIDIETIDSLQKKEKVMYTTFFNTNDKNFAMIFDAQKRETGQKQKSTMIFDNKNAVMIILSEENGERKGVAMQMPPDTAKVETTNEENNSKPADFVHPFYKPTGRTKTIAGYNCKEYTYQSMEDKISLWVTNDSKLNLSKAYEHMNGFQAMGTLGMAYGLGMVMEMETERLLSGESAHMVVKDIQTNSAKTLDVTGYQIIGMGGK